MALGRPKASTNLVTNGGFESNLTGWAAVGAGEVTLTRITTDSAEGTACANAACNGAFASQGLRLIAAARAAVSPNTNYIMQAKFKIDAGVAYEVGFDEFTAVGSGTFVTSNKVTGTATGEWQYVTLTVTTNAATNGAQAFVQKNQLVAATVRADAVQIEPGAVATPYIATDGGTASRPALKWVA